MKILCQRRRPQIKFQLAIAAHHVAAQDQFRNWID